MESIMSVISKQDFAEGYGEFPEVEFARFDGVDARVLKDENGSTTLVVDGGGDNILIVKLPQ